MDCDGDFVKDFAATGTGGAFGDAEYGGGASSMLLELLSSSVFSFEDRSSVPKKVNNIESGTKSDGADRRTHPHVKLCQVCIFLQSCLVFVPS